MQRGRGQRRYFKFENGQVIPNDKRNAQQATAYHVKAPAATKNTAFDHDDSISYGQSIDSPAKGRAFDEAADNKYEDFAPYHDYSDSLHLRSRSKSFNM